MKKLFFAPLLIVAALLVCKGSAHAAAELPAAAVWFEPSDATAGAPVTLNALVYNSQSVDATVTVVFASPTATIASEVQTISAQSAKTVSTAWKMPTASTVVTAKITAATDKNKKSLPSLLGTVGTVTVTVSSAPAPLIGGIAIPGAPQLTAWASPFLNKIEAFRIREANTLTALRDATKLKVTSNLNEAFSHPINYLTLLYSTLGAGLFGNQAIFYVAGVLLILLVLRFVVNLIF